MSAGYKCPYDNLLILNFATTRDENNYDYASEIIQFSVIVLNTKEKKIREDVKFDKFVRPIINPTLSDYCTNHTGISQNTVDSAEPFPVVFEEFSAWLQENDFQETRYAFVVFSRRDLWFIAQYQFLLVKQPLPAMFKQWVDMNATMKKAQQGQDYHRPEENIIQDMSNIYNIPYEGTAHNAMDNCHFLAKITKRVLDDGNLVVVNERLQCTFGYRVMPLTVDPQWKTIYRSAMEVLQRILPLAALHIRWFLPEDDYGVCPYCKQPADVCTGMEHKQYPTNVYEQLREPSVFAVTAGLVKEPVQQSGHFHPNRYNETGEFKAAGVHGKAVSVVDTFHNREGLIMKSTSRPEDYRRELTVLQAMRQRPGFPNLYDFFTAPAQHDAVQYCLIMDYEGDCLHTVSKRTEGGISNFNLMRIAFKLLWTLESLHMHGFCHRDMHAGNVLIRREYDGIVRIKLIDFGMSLPLNPPPIPETNLTSWHASLQVCRHEAYTRFDDLTSGIFVAMWSIGLNPFGDEKDQYLAKKATFDQDPFFHLNSNLKWLAQLYSEVDYQRTAGYSHHDLFEIFYRFNPDFEPTSPITHTVTDNQLIIE
ncbi:hypothetical protein L3Y34_010834 [Caenorhabditis briggsae]|uniref:Protein kinase domain-containing protein n=1 Tax=Caenorhabditis briggsae TaxID=6238 RepID=A0AAE8ZQ92_CAEBR|nr:hypothetical protein L3Y34_010834 [Caenorhabditis briggsae]